MRKYFGEFGLLLTAIIWGSGFVASSISLNAYTPYQVTAFRFLIGAVFLYVLFYKKLQFHRAVVKKGIVLGSILYLAFLLQTVGLMYTTPSKNAFLTAVNVVIVPFIALFFNNKKVDFFEFIGAFLAVIGVGVLSLQFQSGINFGDLLTLFCAVAFAFHIFFTSEFVKDEDTMELTIVQLATAATFGLIVVAFMGEWQFSVNTEEWFSVFYLGIFSTSIAYFLQTASQKIVSETKTAIILSTESLWGMIFSVLLLKELVSLRMVIGAMLILLSIIISETGWKFIKKQQLSSGKVNRM
ncbi:DMT family transporter [Fervidibacillus albus]|uniref:DMT family transporter n=1 Tax=Fervidibacillus albus TaxID=2980026 RepID=A0A9E8LST7_9BACI|nr:DMT family transporter [Fervidibacillus albus]WAA08886.1 DMT family transporter [Fervidibacillus albus]